MTTTQNQNKQTKEGDQKDKDKQSLPSAAEKITALEAEVKVLQQQLKQRSEDEKLKKQEEAEQAEKERMEKLEADTNLAKLLDQALSEDTEDKKTKVDEMTPTQLLSAVGDAFGKASDAQSKLLLSRVENKLAESNQRIEGTQQVLIKLIAGLGVKEAEAQYKDFGEFRDEVRDVLQKTQGLSPEDAYLLAKARKSKDQIPQKKVESEKPNAGLSRSERASSVFSGGFEAAEEGSGQEESSQPKVGASYGRAAFMSALDGAIDKVLASRQG